MVFVFVRRMTDGMDSELACVCWVDLTSSIKAIIIIDASLRLFQDDRCHRSADRTPHTISITRYPPEQGSSARRNWTTGQRAKAQGLGRHNAFPAPPSPKRSNLTGRAKTNTSISSDITHPIPLCVEDIAIMHLAKDHPYCDIHK